jgi:transposase
LRTLDATRALVAFRNHSSVGHHAKDYLGKFFRRITRKLVKPQAITATAHKLARIVFNLLRTKEACHDSVFTNLKRRPFRRAEYRLRKQTAQLGFQALPAESE